MSVSRVSTLVAARVTHLSATMRARALRESLISEISCGGQA
jgi:hypothetical protein